MCCGDIVTDEGFDICTGCGRTLGRHLETRLVAYAQGALYFPRGYSRKSRFEKKVLGALRRLSVHKVEVELMDYLKTRDIQTPQQLLREIGQYPTDGRRPYIYIMYYWVGLGFKQPMILERDMDILKREFDQLFFAWERLGFPNPKFPYSYTFKKLVLGQKKYSQGMRDLVPFVRTLRCPRRRERYDRLFAICREFDFKKIIYKETQMDKTDMEEKIDEMEIEYPATEVYAHERVAQSHRHTMSPYDCRNMYKTQAEVQHAFKTGTFDVAKTMHIGKDGKFYFLEWKNQTQTDTLFKRNQMKLTEMLKDQALL